ncbi:hypothetical protein ACCO45_011997 [Purpureocillium lilacinum]|uniref:Uncharacterized protein n=1 Tax=Purpureocillium lilacinum TaxID=33203 RepID=A0ACC4DF29_PURLI
MSRHFACADRVARRCLRAQGCARCPNTETFALDPHGKYWYMGPTSSWAICRRVLAIVGNQMPTPNSRRRLSIPGISKQ